MIAESVRLLLFTPSISLIGCLFLPVFLLRYGLIQLPLLTHSVAPLALQLGMCV